MRLGNITLVYIGGFIWHALNVLIAMANLNVAVGDAVEAAQDAYDQAETHPFDHGFAHVAGVDGRTALATALEEHPDVDTSDWSYVTIDGLSRYCEPQKVGYKAFIETLEDYGVDVSDVYVSARLD